jgi:23S rRNA pseudouridine2605 synthase
MAQKKIQLILRDAGLASRREAEEMIRAGSVTINGQIVEDPAALVDPETDHIKVNGKLLKPTDTKKYYYLFNKPRNVVCTMKDPEGRPCLGDLIKSLKRTLFSVGRLDFDAEGLMILTNDGSLAQKMSHPSNKMPRTYLVKVRGNPDKDVLGSIKKGMSIGEGDRLGEVSWTVIKRQKTTTWIKLVLFEGKKNEIKRVFFRLMHPVRKIRRIAFGPFKLGSLPVGDWRPLTPAKTTQLASLISPDSPRPKK